MTLHYEKTEHFLTEKHTRNGLNRDQLNPNEWQRGTPVYATNGSHPRSESTVVTRMPAERIVDDYRRVDYEYDGDSFVVRRPPSVGQYRNSVAVDNRSDYGYERQRAASRSEFSSPNSDRGRHYEKAVEKVVSRPGSPGPVAGQGQIINTEHGFTIELDVNHFRANEIKVCLNESLLCVNGERIEHCGDGQSLRRSFSRKYSIPTDIHLDSIKSHLTDQGILVINGSRNGWKETNIYVQAGRSSRNDRQSIISTV